MKTWKLIGIAAVSALSLAACQTDGTQTGQNYDKNNPNVEQTRHNDNTGDRLNNRGNRDGNIDGNNRDRNRNTNLNNRDRGTNRNNTNMNRNNTTNNNDGNANQNNNNRYQVAEEAADKITDEVNGIDRAYVLTTNNNAYVAAVLDENDQNENDRTRDINNNNTQGDDDEISDEKKKKIKDVVQSVDNDIDNVYVSTNPDFVDLTNNYVDDMNEGKPIRGFFDQFGNMIERLFPQNRR